MVIIFNGDSQKEIVHFNNTYPFDWKAPSGKSKYSHKHPSDNNNDNVAKLCLNRSHDDCDYAINQAVDEPNESTFVMIPWKGKLTIPHRVKKIFGPNDDTSISKHTEIRVNRKVTGGSNPLVSPAGATFKDYINFTVDEANKETILSWDILQPKGRFGQATLFDRYERVDWWWHIAMNVNPYFNNDRDGDGVTMLFSATSFTKTSFPDPGDEDFYDQIPLMFAFSCLAKGSMVEMANGKQKAIENIKVGEIVRANGTNMRVSDVSIGIETIPMVRVKDNLGHSVLLTESHPIETLARGIVWANELEPGNWIYSSSGNTRVTSLSMEKYNDNVYNLKLEPLYGNTENLSNNSYAFYANGILVGDLSMQSSYEFKNVLDTTEDDVLGRLPKEWHQDYFNAKYN